ncbi:MAG: glycosyltransferase [Acidobacteria bacterium]|nr:glycosyltransferase [Acidobacteriota bacterium]
MSGLPAAPDSAASAGIAFVRDWMTVYAGADRVMEAALELYPGAPVYALVCQEENFGETPIASHPIRTSFIQRLPLGRSAYRMYLPLMPLAIEQFDLRAYPIVVSLSHSIAKGVLTRADQLHVCYVYTPMRYAWDLYFEYLQGARVSRGMIGPIARLFLHYLRVWDESTAGRPDVLIADSRHVAHRIWKRYRREAQVIYPPVDVHRFEPRLDRDDFYLTVSRLVPYKRVRLIIEAFNHLKRPLVVIGDGPERRPLSRLAGPTVRLLGAQPDRVVRDHMERCKAFVFAAEEDFGIAAVEAQAAGAPVIAYGRGGVTETVVAGETGLFFHEPTPESLADAVRGFEQGRIRFHPELLRRSAERFNRHRFQREFLALIDHEWNRFCLRQHDVPARDDRSLRA